MKASSVHNHRQQLRWPQQSQIGFHYSLDFRQLAEWTLGYLNQLGNTLDRGEGVFATIKEPAQKEFFSKRRVARVMDFL